MFSLYKPKKKKGKQIRSRKKIAYVRNELTRDQMYLETLKRLSLGQGWHM